MRKAAIIAAAAAVWLGLAGVSPAGPATAASTATTAPGWSATSVSTVDLPSAKSGSRVVEGAISCPVAGWCGAVGDYQYSGGASAGLLEVISSTVSAVPVPLGDLGDISTTQTTNRLVVDRISCPQQGFCVAVGTYNDTSGNAHGLIATYAGGRWSATPAPTSSLEGSGTTRYSVSLTDVSCSGSGACVAVGTDALNDFAVIGTLAGGTWTFTKAPLPAVPSPSLVGLGRVSCPTAGFCTAVGSVTVGNSTEGLVETLSGGAWSASFLPKSSLAPLAPGSTSDSVTLLQVDCPDTTMCAATGTYVAGPTVIGFVATRPAGGAWTVTASPGPYSDVDPESLSCPAAGWCSAIANTAQRSATGAEMLTLSGGTWSAVPAPATGTDDPSDVLRSISCAGVGTCVAVGINMADGGLLIDTLAGGTWTAYQAPLTGTSPAATPTTGTLAANLNYVSCPAAGACTATGSYVTGTQRYGLLEQQAPSPTLYVAAGGTDSGNDCTAGVNPCATVSHAVSQAGAGTIIDLAGTVSDNVAVPAGGGPLYITHWPNTAAGVLDGGGATVITVGSGATVTVHGITVQNAGAGAPGIEISGGHLVLDDTTVTGSGHGIDLADAQSVASVTAGRLVGDTVGAYATAGTMQLLETTVDGSSGSGVYNAAAEVTVADSTVSRSAGAAGIASAGGSLTLSDDTIADNAGDGIDVTGGSTNLVADTVSANSTGIRTAGTPLAIAASIVAGNPGGNCAGLPSSSGGYNMTDDQSGAACGFTSPSDVVAATPALGPLSDNGGPTQTILPGVAQSVAHRIPGGTTIAGSAPLCGSGQLDQRGAVRPYYGPVDSCTIGATEVAITPPVITSAYGDVVAGQAGQYQVTATGAPAPGFTEKGALPAGLHLSASGLLSGTPAPGTGGIYPTLLTASNGVAPDDTIYAEVVVEEAPAFTSPASTTFTVGSPGSFQPRASGYPAPSVRESGALPKGVTFSIYGVLSGIPDAGTAGSYRITLTADNSVAPAVTQSFTLVVKPITCATARGEALPDAVGIAAVDRYGCPGYYVVDSAGQVSAFGSAVYHGGLDSPTAGIVGMVAKPDGSGYWLVSAAGAVYAFGTADDYGDVAGVRLDAPVLGITATQDGRGYWLIAKDGGIFTFGDALFYGSMGGQRLDAPVDGMAVAPGGHGYWLVAADGGVFTFTQDGFYGSMGGHHLDKPVIGMAGTPDGRGYTLVGSDGGVFNFGDSRFYGSLGGTTLSNPVVDLSPDPFGNGYYLVDRTGAVFAFGPGARYFGGA